MFIKLNHKDTICLINLLKEATELDPQEKKTLNKLELILTAQKQAKAAKSSEVSESQLDEVNS